MAFPTGWGRKCAVTISSTYVSGTSHTDFPVLITEDMLPSEMFDADGSYPALSGGGDIRFSSDSAGSTQLACEIVSFVTDNNPANGSAEIWVKVPTLSGSTDTTIYVWYDKAGESQPAVTDTYGAQAVWSNYEAVFHFGETPDGTSGDIHDSSPNAVHGTSSGMDGTNVSSGLIAGSALTFDGSSEGINLGDVTYLDGATSATFQAWARFDVLQQDDAILRKYTAGAQSFVFCISDTSNQQLTVAIRGTGYLVKRSTNAALATSTTYSLAGVWSGGFAGAIYKNGTALSTTNDVNEDPGSIANTSSDLGIGYRPAGSDKRIDGILDEVRMSAAALSADWIATEYNNQSSPGTFASAGTPESVGGGATVTLSNPTASATSSTTATVGCTVTYT